MVDMGNSIEKFSCIFAGILNWKTDSQIFSNPECATTLFLSCGSVQLLGAQTGK